MVIKEPPLEKGQVQLSENFRMTADKYNYVLLVRGRKQEGRGKGAPLSNEYIYKSCGYFSSPSKMFERILEQEMRDHVSELDLKNVEDFKVIADELNKRVVNLAKEINDNFIEKVTIVINSKRHDVNAIHKVLEDEVEGDDD